MFRHFVLIDKNAYIHMFIKFTLCEFILLRSSRQSVLKHVIRPLFVLLVYPSQCDCNEEGMYWVDILG